MLLLACIQSERMMLAVHWIINKCYILIYVSGDRNNTYFSVCQICQPVLFIIKLCQLIPFLSQRTFFCDRINILQISLIMWLLTKGLVRADDLSSPKTLILAEMCLNLLTLCPRYMREAGSFFFYFSFSKKWLLQIILRLPGFFSVGYVGRCVMMMIGIEFYERGAIFAKSSYQTEPLLRI